ncbi:hypothetical protein [Nonomuraea sp. NPDC048916]|uniref:hypothetical protein n=1 Tax=Nonomuraea sp. NPDC048916 TaxID=3154232 RepID=UPI0033E6F25E
MTDALGWRRKFGVIAPSTNTIVEPDFHRMTVPGVTSHFSRIPIRDQNMPPREKTPRREDRCGKRAPPGTFVPSEQCAIRDTVKA